MSGRAVVAVVNYNGMVLIGKKRSDSEKKLAGQWHVLGERVEEGESDEEALIRGVREEAGLDIRVGRYLGFNITPTSRSEAKWYECFSDTDKVSYSSDLENIRWVPKGKVLESCGELAASLWSREVLEYFRK